MLFQPTISANHEIVTDPSRLSGMVAACRGQTVAFDFETGGLRWWDGQLPVGYSLAVWLEGEPILARGTSLSRI